MEKKELVTTIDRPPYDLPTILRMKMNGKSLRAIAKVYGVTHQAIAKKLKGVFAMLDPERLQAYREQKVELLTAMEERILTELCQPSRLKRVNFIDFGIIYDKNRLEQGKSTANISLHGLVREAMREALQKEPEGSIEGENTA